MRSVAKKLERTRAHARGGDGATLLSRDGRRRGSRHAIVRDRDRPTFAVDGAAYSLAYQERPERTQQDKESDAKHAE